MSLAGVRLTRPNHSRLLALIISLIITACALSPQTVINPSGEIKVPVRNALATALHNYRFAVALPGVSAPLAMTVTIENIRYTPSGAPLVNGESYMEVERVTRIPGRADARRAIRRMAKSFGRTTFGTDGLEWNTFLTVLGLYKTLFHSLRFQ
jgi:hypothetical protein